MLVFAVAGFYLLASWLSRSRVLDIRVTWNRLGVLGPRTIPIQSSQSKNLSIQDLVKVSSLSSGGSIPKCPNVARFVGT